MQIRPLTAADARIFQAIRLRGLGECPMAFSSSFEEECDQPLEYVANRLASNFYGAVFGAFVGDALAGIAGVYRETECKLAHKATIWTVYVAPPLRRQGIARQLLHTVLRHSFETMSVRQVNLGVNAANTGAKALYESLGFETFGVERAFMIVDGVPQDEVMMVLYRSRNDG